MAVATASLLAATGMERVIVSPDGHGFVLARSGKAFAPWGFNYDHDEKGWLIEDYWEKEWAKVEEDFREMKQIGARVVRASRTCPPGTTRWLLLERDRGREPRFQEATGRLHGEVAGALRAEAPERIVRSNFRLVMSKRRPAGLT